MAGFRGLDRNVLGLLAAVWLAGAAAGQPGARPGEWKFDVLHLNNGRRVQGLLVEESPLSVRFRYVVQRPGRGTVALPATTFAAHEIGRVERLSPEDRRTLAARLEVLDAGASDEAGRMSQLVLEKVPGDDGRSEGLRYTAEHFVLWSDACEDVVRRVAVRLEQLYDAFADFLPPRPSLLPLSAPGKEGRGRETGTAPTEVRLVQSLRAYQALLQKQGRSLTNPAFFDPAANRIVCACDLEQLGDDLERVRRKHQDTLERLATEEAELKRRYGGKVPARLLEPLQAGRRQIERANKDNAERFERATRRFFQVLYHEAFHAYLANAVYPADQAAVPRWLNEGLAQVFEGAVLEAGALRVGHPDPDRLARAKAAVRAGQLVPVAELLRSGPRDFLVAHAGERAASDRHYLAAWALAFYLAFDRHKLGTPELDDYVRALKRGADPAAAFRGLAGEPLAAFEKGWRQYLLELRSDGSRDRK
jgi:hypothetical protein